MSGSPQRYVITLRDTADKGVVIPRLKQDHGITEVCAKGRVPMFNALVPDPVALSQDASVLGIRLMLVPPYRYVVTLCEGIDKLQAIERMTLSYSLTDVAGAEWEGGEFSAVVPESTFWKLASDRMVYSTRLVGLSVS